MKKEYRKPEMAVYEIHQQKLLLDSSFDLSSTGPDDNNEDIY